MCQMPDLTKLNRIVKIWDKAENVNENECLREEEADKTGKNYIEQGLEEKNWESENSQHSMRRTSKTQETH